MGGLMFLAVVALWLYLLKWIAGKIAGKLPDRPWRAWVKWLIFALLLPLPLIDEIVGGWQFKELCEANVVWVNKEAARGKSVYREPGSYQMPVSGTWVKVWKMTFRYLDLENNAPIVSFDQYSAEGGHFFPGFDSGHDPLTFKGECHPPGTFDKGFLGNLGFTEVKRPKSIEPIGKLVY
ncbi:hypothetical protein ACFX58_01985 [Sphingomonas sp. NCPPB 2930]